MQKLVALTLVCVLLLQGNLTHLVSASETHRLSDISTTEPLLEYELTDEEPPDIEVVVPENGLSEDLNEESSATAPSEEIEESSTSKTTEEIEASSSTLIEEIEESSTTPIEETEELSSTTPIEETEELSSTTPIEETEELSSTTPIEETEELSSTTSIEETEELSSTTPFEETEESSSTTPIEETEESSSTTPIEELESSTTTPNEEIEESPTTTPNEEIEEETTISGAILLEEISTTEADSEEKDANLRVELNPFSSALKDDKLPAGEVLNVRVITEYFEPTASNEQELDDYTTIVRIPIPNEEVRILDFETSNVKVHEDGYRYIIIAVSGKPVTFKLYGEDGTKDRYIEYETAHGNSIIEFKFLFPNGIIDNNTEFELIPESDYEKDTYEYGGRQEMIGFDPINIVSTFEWGELVVSNELEADTLNVVTPTEADSSIGKLDNSITYQIKAESMNDEDSGSIYTESYELESKIRFAKGVYTDLMTDNVTHSWPNSSTPVIVVSDEDAMIIPVTEDGKVIGFDIVLMKENKSYASYQTEELDAFDIKEMEHLDLQITLFRENINVDIPLFNEVSENDLEDMIKNDVSFTAYPIFGSEMRDSKKSNISISPIPSHITSELTASPESLIYPGEEIIYTIEIKNEGWGKGTAEMHSTLPNGTEFVEQINTQAGIVLLHENNTIHWTGEIAGKASVILKFSVKVNNDLNNGFNIVYDTFVNDKHMSVAHTTPLPNLNFEITSNQDVAKIVKAGSEIEYTITINNSDIGRNSINAIGFIPINTKLKGDASIYGAEWNNGKLVWPMEILAGKSSLEYRYTVIVDEDVANSYTIQNDLSTVNGTMVGIHRLNTPSVTISDINIDFKGETEDKLSDNRVRPGEKISYHIKLTNTSEGNADFTISDQLTSLLTLIPDSIKAVKLVNGNEEVFDVATDVKQSLVSWKLFMKAGESIILSFDAKVHATTDRERIVNSIKRSMNGEETFYDKQVTHNLAVPKLSFDLTSNPPNFTQITPGSDVTYYVNVKNEGTDDGETIIKARMPNGSSLNKAFLNDEELTIGSGESDVKLELLDGWLWLTYTTMTPANSILTFSFQTTAVKQYGVESMEQIAFINEMKSLSITHSFPLPRFGQKKSAEVRFVNENGNLELRTNNVITLDGEEITIIDPEALDEESVFEGNEMALVFANDQITYQITAYNYGNGMGFVEVRDTIPHGTELITIGEQGEIDPENITGRSLIWNIYLDPGTEEEPTEKTVTFTVRVKDGLKNGYNIANQASVGTELTNRLDYYLPTSNVKIEKLDATKGIIPPIEGELRQVELGDTIVYAIKLTNSGFADGIVRVMDQIPPGVIFKSVYSEGDPDGKQYLPTQSGINSVCLTWNNLPVKARAGMEGSGIPALTLYIEVQVKNAEEYQKAVDKMLGIDPNLGGDVSSGQIVVKPGDDTFPTDDSIPDINDTEQIFNYAVLSDELDGKKDRFSNTIRHMVIRPIFSYQLSANPEDKKDMKETDTSPEIAEGDLIYYFVDIKNSGHSDGNAHVYSEIPELTKYENASAYMVVLDDESKEDGTRISIPDTDFLNKEFKDKDGKTVSGIFYNMEVSANTIMRFAFAVRVKDVFDGFRIEETAWVNQLRSNIIYHYFAIPKVTISQSASHVYGPRRATSESITDQNYPTLWQNGRWVPYPFENDLVGMPSENLSNGVEHLINESGYDPLGPTVIRAGDRFTYYITLYAEGKNTVVDVTDKLPKEVIPITDTARILTIDGVPSTTSAEIITSGNIVTWKGVNLIKTTDDNIVPVVLAVDVVANIPSKNGLVISNTAEVTSYLQTLNNEKIETLEKTALSNPVEFVMFRNDTDFTKKGASEYGNGSYVQEGEKIEFTLTLKNPVTSIPKEYNITDILDKYLEFVDGSVQIEVEKLPDAVDGTDVRTHPIYGEVSEFSYNYKPDIDSNPSIETEQFTADGGLFPGEFVEIRFTAKVKQEIESTTTIKNTAYLNGDIPSNTVYYTVYVEGSNPPPEQPIYEFNITKTHEAPNQIASGSVINYNINVTSNYPVTKLNTIVTDTLSQYTTYVDGSTKLTGAYGYEFGGIDSSTGLPFRPSDTGYDLTQFCVNGILKWVVDIEPNSSVDITYQTTVNEKTLEGTVISNTARIANKHDTDTITLKPVVKFEKYSSQSANYENNETKQSNWDLNNASIIVNGDTIDYYIDLWLPEGYETSRFVNITDSLPYISTKQYGSSYYQGEPRTSIGPTKLTGAVELSWINPQTGDIISKTTSEADFGLRGSVIYGNNIEIPAGVIVQMHFSVIVQLEESQIAKVNQNTQILIENFARICNSKTNSVFHEMGRAAIVAEKYIGVTVQDENGQFAIKWVQTEDGMPETDGSGMDEQVTMQVGQVYPYKILLGNVGNSNGHIAVREQINNLLRVVEATANQQMIVTDIEKILTTNETLQANYAMGGKLIKYPEANGQSFGMAWDNIPVDADTAYINGWMLDKTLPDDPRRWLNIQNQPDSESTTVNGLNFTITKPVEIIFYVQIIGDPDQGQQISAHALHNMPYLETNKVAGMGRTNQVDLYVQNTRLVARQYTDIPEIPEGADIKNNPSGNLERGQEIMYTIEVANAGGTDGLVDIDFPIPDGMEVVRTSSDANTNTPNHVIFQRVPVKALGYGWVSNATGEVILDPVNGEPTYIAIGDSQGTYVTERLMPWPEDKNDLAVVQIVLRTKEDIKQTNEDGSLTVIEGITNGSRIDSAPNISEITEYEYEIPTLNPQKINVFPSVLSHYIPMEYALGGKTAEFDTLDGKHVIIGQIYVQDETTGIWSQQPEQIWVDGTLITTEDEKEQLLIDREVEITYHLTAYNSGSSRVYTQIYDKVPLHTEFVSADDFTSIGEDHVLLWNNVEVPAKSSITKSFTVKVSRDIANGVTIMNTGKIAGKETNQIVLKTLPPDVRALNEVSVDGGMTYHTGNINVKVGDTVQYRITVKNIGLGSAIIHIEDQISAYLQVDDATIKVTGGSASDKGQLDGDKVIWEDILLVPGAQIELSFNAIVGITDDSELIPPAHNTHIRNVAVYNNAIQDVLDANLDEDAAKYEYVAGLGLAKTEPIFLVVQEPLIVATQTAVCDKMDGSLAFVLPLGKITYTIEIRNEGGVDEDVVVTNKIPEGTTLLHPENYSFDENGAIQWFIHVKAGEPSQKLTFTVEIKEDILSSTMIENKPIIENWKIEPEILTHHLPPVNINGEMSVSNLVVSKGDMFIYTITLTNRSAADAMINVRNQIPAGVTLLDNSISENGTLQGDVIIWENVRVKASYPKVLYFIVNANDLPNGTIIYNKAEYGTKETNEVQTTITAPVFEGELTANIQKSDGTERTGSYVQYGDTITYTIRIKNTGGLAGSTTVTNQIPDGVTLLETTIGSAILDKNNNMLTWKDVQVQGGNEWVASYQVKVNQPPDGTIIRNENAAYHEKTLNSIILFVAAPIITASLSASPYNRNVVTGQLIEFTVTVNNLGKADGNADVTAVVPVGMEFVNHISGAGSADPSKPIWSNVSVVAGGVTKLVYQVKVTGRDKSGNQLSEGFDLISKSHITDLYTNETLDTNETKYMFVPETIYPDLSVRILGHYSSIESKFIPVNQFGMVNGAGRMDGMRLSVEFDNIGGSINSTHVAMENYQVQVALPIMHVLDEENYEAQLIISDMNGNEISRIPLSANYADPDYFKGAILSWNFTDAGIILYPGYKARIEFQTKLTESGNTGPLHFKAYLIPDASQLFNEKDITKGVKVIIDGKDALEAVKSIFIVSEFTTRSNITVETEPKGTGVSASGDGYMNKIATSPGSSLIYTLVLQNTSNETYKDVILLGQMPYVNDKVLINNAMPRNSKFVVDLNEVMQITLNGNPLSQDYYRLQYRKSDTGLTSSDWKNTTNWKDTKQWMAEASGQSYRLTLVHQDLAPGDTLEVQLKANVPLTALAGSTAWKSFAYQYRPESLTNSLQAEVNVVGVELIGLNVMKKVTDNLVENDETFVIQVAGEFSDGSMLQNLMFTADEVRNETIKAVPNVVLGNTYIISEPEHDGYEVSIDYEQVTIGDNGSDALVTVTNTKEINKTTISIQAVETLYGSNDVKVRIPIRVAGNPGIQIYDISIAIPQALANHVNKVSFEYGNVVNRNDSYELTGYDPIINKPIPFAYILPEPNKNNGTIATLVLDIDKETEGTYDLKIINHNLFKDIFFTPITDLDIVNGSLMITKTAIED